MLQLNAQALRDKRELILNKSLAEDYENTLRNFTDFFDKEDNLLVDYPEVIFSTKYEKTKLRLIEEFKANGFIVYSGDDNSISVALYDKYASLREQNVVAPDPVVNIVEEKPVVTEETKVVIKQPTYNHTDLQMSGGSPF